MSIFSMLRKTEKINEDRDFLGRPVIIEGVKAEPGPLPVEAQILLRVMGEDLSAARDLLRDMPPLERAVLMFYIEQVAGLVYEAEGI